MKRKTSIAAFLITGFLGSTYVAISQTNTNLLSPFLVKQRYSMTVGREAKCHENRTAPLTLQDVEEGLQSLSWPVSSTPSAAVARCASQGQPPANPLLEFAGQFTCADDLAAAALAKNAEEHLWNSDGLFHVIQRSGKCTSTKIAQLGTTYCTCPH